MNTALGKNTKQPAPAGITALGAWALAFGCSVGRGAFTMPGSTFLPAAGPIGTLLGLGLGGAVMLLLAMNYHYLMNRQPELGGTYAFARSSFGYDYGFLTAWFLALAYLAILCANSVALPMICRILFGDALQFGFHYVLAGYHVYLGEVLLSVLVLCVAALLCLHRKVALRIQIVLSLALLAGVVICAAAALSAGGGAQAFRPAFSPAHSPLSGTLAVFGLAPWAYMGFESISHSAPDARFSLKRSFPIMAAALVAGALAYILLSLLSATALPEGCASWYEYVSQMEHFEGLPSQSTFFAAHNALGSTGVLLLGAAALCAILTCLISCFFALSRLLCALSADRLLAPWFGKLDEHQVPRNGIVAILVVSVFFPLLGLTTISGIVDVTTVGATIAYGIVSGAALKSARKEKEGRFVLSGTLGLVVSVFFSLEFLVPSFNVVRTLSTQSYLILALWGVLGFLVLRMLITHDTEKRLGRSVFSLALLLLLTIFSASVWSLQSANAAVERSVAPLHQQYTEETADPTAVEAAQSDVERTLRRTLLIQVGMIVIAMTVTMDLYAFTQNRERRGAIEKALAAETSRARSSFLSNMSHEIRTPMNAIIGLDNIALRNPNLPPETREQLEKIGESANHLLSLLKDILDMSLIEAGTMTLKEEEFSLQELLEQLNADVSAKCAEKGLHYECAPAGMLREFYCGDSAKLRRALVNVLGNAVKFTDAPGRVWMNVEQTQETQVGCTLRFTVHDTGIGISEEFLPQLFQPFSQEDITNTSRFGGSGLGLAIAQRFLGMMDGSIEVESEKGIGSVFTLTVPLKPSQRSFQTESGTLPVLRAAVVDNSPSTCEHEQTVLKTLDIEADAFQDPWEAIEHIRQAHQRGRAYDLVICDFKLTSMNGLELTRMIRSFDGDKTAVIMLTGYNWDIVSEEALQGGVDSIGAKPLFPDSLRKEISTVLAKKAGIQPPAEEEQTVVPLAGHRILIAEDIDQNAEILRDLLEMEDISTEHASNGKLAVEMFATQPAGYYDAVLMDVRMPVMDGLTATQAIRAMEREDAKTIPIIAMTANAFDEDVQLSLEAGMNAHLTKPLELDLLYTTLRRYFALKQS